MRQRLEQASILIIDDDVPFASSLEKTLCKAGYKVHLAAGAVEAQQILDSSSFDLIITDYRMRPLSGLEVLSWVRRRGIPARVVLLTAFGSEELTARAQRLGADACLSKPVKRGEILDCVARLLARRADERERGPGPTKDPAQDPSHFRPSRGRGRSA